jgi:hypothetical protein
MFTEKNNENNILNKINVENSNVAFVYSKENKKTSEYIKNLFFKKYFVGTPVRMIEDNITINYGGEIFDTKNNYILNSFDFRSIEFSNDPVEILFGGCSNTFGAGVPENGTWTSILAKEKVYVNLGTCGASIELIINNLSTYLDNYPKPKNIICLFPDLLRTIFISDPAFHVSDNKNNYILNNLDVMYSGLSSIDESGNLIPNDKFVKNPFEIRKGISPHVAIHNSIKSIYHFEKRCESEGINFVWSLWHNWSKQIINNLFEYEDFYLNKKNYIDFAMEDFNVNCNDTHNSKLFNSIAWHNGTDEDNHPGIHWQTHVAELFKEKI